MSVRRWGVGLALIGLLVLGAVALSGCAPAVMAGSNVAEGEQARTITVVGTGEVKAKPDVARVSLGIEVTAPTVTEAVEAANQRMMAILAALKELGISDKDIQTSNYSVTFERLAPEPTPVEGTSATSGGEPQGFYRVNNMVEVTVRDLDAVDDILDAAVKAGANNIWGVSFGLDDTSALEEAALAKAVTDAKATAQSLAELNGVGLGQVMAISTIIGSAGPFYAEAAAKGYSGGGGPVEPGELTFATQVQVVYAIR